MKADRGLTDDQWNGISRAMQRAFPYAMVAGYESAMAESSRFVRDPDDAHVVAAAGRAGCDTIVTENIRHLDVDALGRVGLRAGTSDEFLTGVFLDRQSRNRVLTMRAEIRDQPEISTLLATLWNSSRL